MFEETGFKAYRRLDLGTEDGKRPGIEAKAGPDAASVLLRLQKFELRRGYRDVRGYGYREVKRGRPQTRLERLDSNAAARRRWQTSTRPLQLSAPSVQAKADFSAYQAYRREVAWRDDAPSYAAWNRDEVA